MGVHNAHGAYGYSAGYRFGSLSDRLPIPSAILHHSLCPRLRPYQCRDGNHLRHDRQRHAVSGQERDGGAEYGSNVSQGQGTGASHPVGNKRDVRLDDICLSHPCRPDARCAVAQAGYFQGHERVVCELLNNPPLICLTVNKGIFILQLYDLILYP